MWIREKDSEFKVEFVVNSRRRSGISKGFAIDIVNWKWISENNSDFVLSLRIRLWIQCEFAKRKVNSEWNREKDSQFEIIREKIVNW